MNRGLIVTHGKMGMALKDTLELIVGPVDCIDALSFGQCDSIDELCNTISRYIETYSNDHVFLFSDIMGGSCANTSLRFLQEERVHMYAGINLPMLIVFYTFRKSTAEEICTTLVTQAREAIVDLRYIAEQRKRK